MKYRKLGRTGLEIGEIGMGLEHLLDKEENVVFDTMKAAVDGGINYFDCLSLLEYSQSAGTNEGYVKLGKALIGLRERIYISFLASVTKPLSYTEADFACYLQAMNTSYADVFICACCDKSVEFDDVTGEGGLLDYAKRLRSEGKIRYIGFSTHNTEIAHRAIRSGEFDVLMYPINPAFDVIDDEETYNSDILGNIWDKAYAYTSTGKSGTLPRKSVYSACARHGIGLVGMKPFAGGFVLGVEKDAGFTPVNLVSYALAQDGVSTVVPGCESPQQIEEILAYYTEPDDARDYSNAVAKSRWSIKGNCLYCNHCLPCPSSIDIAQINRLLNGFENDSSDEKAALDKYLSLNAKASSCIQCGECESRCPFDVPVIKRMEKARKLFAF